MTKKNLHFHWTLSQCLKIVQKSLILQHFERSEQQPEATHCRIASALENEKIGPFSEKLKCDFLMIFNHCDLDEVIILVAVIGCLISHLRSSYLWTTTVNQNVFRRAYRHRNNATSRYLEYSIIQCDETDRFSWWKSKRFSSFMISSELLGIIGT